ncbi:MAG: ABC transporter substrate-binding protein [Brockia lithotrophica]|nr:ABC transporter substrate-binding protein [Brockia lithotrophica]
MADVRRRPALCGKKSRHEDEDVRFPIPQKKLGEGDKGAIGYMGGKHSGRLRRLAVVVFAWLLASAFWGAGCARQAPASPSAGGGEASPASPAPADVRPPAGENRLAVRVGILPTIDAFPLVVAERTGAFTRRGIEVTLVPFQSASERDSAFLAGQIDGMVSDLVAASLLRGSGKDVRVTVALMEASPETRTFALLGSPRVAWPDPLTPEALRGRQVAMSQNSVVEYVGDRFLERLGVAPREVVKSWVPKMPDRMTMLAEGNVDAAVLPEPLATLAERRGARVLVDDRGNNLTHAVLVFSGPFLAENSRAMEGFFAALREAVDTLNASPERYRRDFVESARVPQELEATYTVPRFPLPAPPPRREIEDVLAWLRGKDLLSTEVTPDMLLAPGFGSR